MLQALSTKRTHLDKSRSGIYYLADDIASRAGFFFVLVPTGNVGDCLGFDAGAPAFTGDAPAWQYI